MTAIQNKTFILPADGSCPFHIMPADIMHRVFAFCDYRDLYWRRLVCNRWKRLDEDLVSDKIVWEEITKRVFPHIFSIDTDYKPLIGGISPRLHLGRFATHINWTKEITEKLFCLPFVEWTSYFDYEGDMWKGVEGFEWISANITNSICSLKYQESSREIHPFIFFSKSLETQQFCEKSWLILEFQNLTMNDVLERSSINAAVYSNSTLKKLLEYGREINLGELVKQHSYDLVINHLRRRFPGYYDLTLTKTLKDIMEDTQEQFLDGTCFIKCNLHILAQFSKKEWKLFEYKYTDLVDNDYLPLINNVLKKIQEINFVVEFAQTDCSHTCFKEINIDLPPLVHRAHSSEEDDDED